MIEFHKIVGKPAKVPAGEERLWFTDSALTYVANNAGEPVRFGAGFREGTTVPVGTPPAAGILYYCSGNGEYYLSNPTEWIVLNTESKMGGGDVSGYAGGVFITDANSYYTSNEVEGALQEIGAAFPHFMGTRHLSQLNSNLLGFKGSGERKVGVNVPSSPTPLSSWLNQRQSSDGRTYGLMVAENGAAWTRHGDNFTQLASHGDLQDAIEQMGGAVGGAIGEIEGIKVRKGLGINVSGSGLISNSPVISINTNEIVQALDGASNFPFLRDTGGKLTGNLTIAKATPAIDLTADIVGSTAKRTIRLFTATNTDNNAGIRDVTGNVNFLNYNMISKTLTINSGAESDGLVVNGRLTVNRKDTQSDRGLIVETGDGHYMTAFVNNRGRISTLSDSNANWIQSDDGSDLFRPKDLTISARAVKKMNNFNVLAYDARFSDRLVAGNGMFLGMDDDHYGKLDFNNKLYMFPYVYRKGQSAATARKYYAHMGYNQDTQTVYIRSFIKNLKEPYTEYDEQNLNVAATKFVNRSSEKFKNVIGEMEGSALDILDQTTPWLYTFKNDAHEKTNLGFIIERGVPEIAIEDDGNSIDSYSMIAILWKAVQELKAEVVSLKK